MGEWETVSDRKKPGGPGWETVSVKPPSAFARWREEGGSRLADVAEAVRDRPLESVAGAAEGLAAGAVGLGSAAVSGIGGLGSTISGKGFEAGAKAARDFTGMSQLERDVAPVTESGKAFYNLLGILPEALHAGGETIFENTGSAALAAGAEGIAAVLALRPQAAGDIGKVAGWAYGPGKSSKGGKDFQSAFEDLASSHPEQAREVAKNVHDGAVRLDLENKIDEITIAKPKQVKEVFEKGIRKSPVEMSEQDVNDLFNRAKRNVAEPGSPPPEQTEIGGAKEPALGKEPEIRPLKKKPPLSIEIIGGKKDLDVGAEIQRIEEHLAKTRGKEPVLTPEQASANVRNSVRAGISLIEKGIYAPESNIQYFYGPQRTSLAEAFAKAAGAGQVVYMHAGIPITRGDLAKAWALGREVLRKSSSYRVIERNIADSVQWLIRNVAPETMSKAAADSAAVIASNISQQMHRESVIAHRGEMRRQFWNSRAGEQLQFIHGFEKGASFADRLLTAAQKGYEAAYSEIAAADKALGLKYDEVSHYLPHAFEDAEAAAKWLNSRYGPKWGDPGFIKERSWEAYEEAITKGGLKPKTTNPEELFQMRAHASEVARMQIQTLRDLEKYGLARKVEKGMQPYRNPDRYELEWRAPNGERYWVPNDVHQILTNAFNSQSLWSSRSPAGAAFRGAMYLKNITVPIKLALSLFHPLHIATIDNATTMTRAAKGLLSGATSPAQFIREMAQGAFYKELVGETAGAFSKRGTGYRLLNTWRGKVPEKDLTEADRLSLQYMTEGGFIPEMAVQYKNNAIRKFRDALQQRSAGTPFKLPGAIIETLQKPIFEEWIPMLKAASYIRDVKRALEADPSLLENPLKRQAAFRQIAKSVDNRYGEMAYNTLFWNRYIRDIGIGSTLSMGWNLGFIREYGGAAGQTFKALEKPAEIKEMAKKGGLDKALFVGFYTAQALAYGGLITWAMTGKPPTQWLDYTHPQTGEAGPDGKPERVNTMFFTREFMAAGKHIQHEGVVSGLGHIVSNKAVPLIDEAKTFWTNVDYFGREVSDPDAPPFKQLEQKLAWLATDQIPISLQGVRQGKTAPKQVALSVMGFSPAPKYATESDAEAAITGMYQRYHKVTTPYERAQFSSAARDLRKMAQTGDPAYEDKLDEIAQKYELGSKEVNQLRKDSDLSSYQKMFKALRSSEQIKVLKKMTPEERESYTPYMHKKTKEALEEEE